MSLILLEDVFDVRSVTKSFQKVNRVTCLSDSYELKLELDVHSELFPLAANQKFSLAITSSLSLTGGVDDGKWDPSETPSLADRYEYVMSGKVYRIVDGEPGSGKITLLASFGGLLMQMEGEQRNLAEIVLDSQIYILLRRSGGG